MSILKYQIVDENQTVSAWVDPHTETVVIQVNSAIIPCDFNDWQKLTSNIAKDIEAYMESKPKDLFFGLSDCEEMRISEAVLMDNMENMVSFTELLEIIS